MLLHAYKSRAATLAPVRRQLQTLWPGARVFCPQLPADVFSCVDPDEIILQLLAGIDALVRDSADAQKPVRSIVIIGHSAGSLLGRKLYIVACGETPDAPFEACYHAAQGPGLIPPRPWAPLVERVILLAGMNRGWRISHHLHPVHAMAWRAGVLGGYALHLFTGRWPLIFKLRRGAEFVTQLRIQWLSLRRQAAQPGLPATSGVGNALTVQLLGSRDDVVSPEDNIDLVAGSDFVYLDVPFSGHADVIELEDPRFGAARASVLEHALRLDGEVLKAMKATPADDEFYATDPGIKHVVFVIHGIRDQGFWTHKIARRVKRLAGDQAVEWATETSSYGYFPMLPFILPWYRRQKVEWLMDQYAEALARYPNATFSYVGHSNGTYLIAKALELYPCCRFAQIVFAGSVVRTGYDWRKMLDASPPRVNAVLNFVATADPVVALFPRFFQQVGWQDLGSAGHDGFDATSEGQGMYQVRYVKGGHGAALTEGTWDAIARFVIDATVNRTNIPNRASAPSRVVRFAGRIAPLIWLGIVVLIGTGAVGLLGICNTIDSDEVRGIAKGFASSGYLLVLWWVLTRV